MVLALVLTVFLTVAYKLGGKDEVNPIIVFIVYVFCLACAVGLGFSGGELMYG
jgi:hypothetical protein